jgi:O-antigen ligase
MDDTSKLVQIIVGLASAVVVLLVAYIASPRKVVPWLICLSPFQFIDSPYATSSVILTYVVGIAYILRGKLQFLPMLGIFAIVIAIYLASTGFAHKSTHVQHAIYMFNYVSAILMFYIVYNFVRETKDVALVIRTLIITNILVVIYSVIQINVGPGFSFFGIEELSIIGARGHGDPRLNGPYGPGITAEFMVLDILLFGYLLIHTNSGARRMLLYLMTALSLGCIIATANRGGFLVLVGGSGLFLIMYRKQLGVKRVLMLSMSGVFLIAVMSIVVVQFTNYGQMYDRLEETELEGGLPDTRVVTWLDVWPRILDKPVLGHGPRLRLYNDFAQPYPGTDAIEYPHNLYLFLLYTVGLVGLIAYLSFFAWLIFRYRAGIRKSIGDPFMHGFIKLGFLFMIVFLVDQLKIEFLRIGTIDYWHYIFSIFAIWLAFADMARNGEYCGTDTSPLLRSASPAQR